MRRAVFQSRQRLAVLSTSKRLEILAVHRLVDVVVEVTCRLGRSASLVCRPATTRDALANLAARKGKPASDIRLCTRDTRCGSHRPQIKTRSRGMGCFHYVTGTEYGAWVLSPPAPR